MSNPSSGRLLHGQKLHGPLMLPATFTRIMDEAATTADPLCDGTANREVEPKDRQASEVTEYNIDLSEFFLSYDGFERRMRLPPVLNDLQVQYVVGGENNDYIETAGQTGSGAFSVSASLAGSAQAAAYCIPKIIPNTKEAWPYEMPAKHCFFFAPPGNLTTADYLTRLSIQLGVSVSAWPVWLTESLTFITTGERVNASARATLQASFATHSSGASATQSIGFGSGTSVSPNIEITQIQPTLHGAFSLSGSAGTSQSASTTISSSGVITLAAGGTANAVAAGTVSPTSVSATSPANLPSSGLYLYDVEMEAASTFGQFLLHAVLFDFSVIAGL